MIKSSSVIITNSMLISQCKLYPSDEIDEVAILSP
jgi:hypothetical protein